ncbi:acyl-CoA dehydrogenase family protein [Nocardia sp. NPDC050175]|uniref:acyl-CoA dehydrogenase family protein n=1 Tax=Nocardia sp. NPDC050175 TaxID=3364317 RepID=UPI0037A733B7
MAVLAPGRYPGGPAVTDPFDTPERRDLGALVRDFTTRGIVPHLDTWERENMIPRSIHKAAAAAGLLGVGYPEAVGGSGGDALDTIVLTEAMILAGGSGGLMAGLFNHNLAVPHMVASGDRRLIATYVRPTLAGEKIGSLGVTEPDGGSDVANLRTRAVRDGDHYVVNGAKTFITSAVRGDYVTTAVRTGAPGYQGISLLVIENTSPGFTVSRRLDKMGWHCSDTAELSFVDVRVPVENRIGGENEGFAHIMGQFQNERIWLAAVAYATAQRCLDLTVEWTKMRNTFGKPLSSRQIVRHQLVEMTQRIELARTYTRSIAAQMVAGHDVVAQVCMAKNAAVAACDFVVDRAVQLHGGLGYLRDSEVERHYRDAKILGIGGGATEVMTDLAAKRLGYQ